VIVLKINNDCVRDVLLHLEEVLNFENFYQVSSDDDDETVLGYPLEDVVYSLVKLSEAGYIDAKILKTLNPSTKVIVRSITWNGHQFLDTIRPQTVWDKTKSSAAQIGSTSLTVLSQIAVAVASQVISKNLNQ
jgi:hypothetical protein